MGPDVGPGVDFAGYRVEILLGRGGMGAVYRAEDLRLRRRVALKILAADLAEDNRFRERFIRESQLAAAIDHPNIIPIYEAGEAEGALFIAMRYVAGSDLKQELQSGRLSPQRTGEIVSAAARALDAAHDDGLVHRDVKPANILLARRTGDDSGEHVYLSDFGLTKRTSSKSGITRTGEFLGTVDYVAPEHIEGGELGPASDEYSLGCTAFECLTGDVPFRKDTDLAVLWAHVREQPPSITSLRPELGPAVDAVLTRALAKSPKDRYPTCREFAADLVAALEPHGAARPAQSQSPRAGRSRTRIPLLRNLGLEGRPSRRLAFLAGGVVAVIAAAIVIVASVYHASPKKAPAGDTAAAPPGAILRIDPEIDKVVKKIRLGSPSTVAVGYGSVWVNDLGTIVRIDSTTDKVVDRIHGPDGYVTPGVQVVTGAGAVWSAGRAGRARVDPKTNKLRRLPWHDNLPRTTGDGNLVAAGALWETTPTGFVLKYDLDNRILKAFKVGTSVGANPIAFGDGAIWVVETAPATLVRIDPHKNRIVQKIPLEGDATGVAAGEGGVWVIDGRNGLLREYNSRANQLLDPVPIPKGASALAVGGGSVWVLSRDAGTVTRVDVSSQKPVATISVGSGMNAIAFGEGGVWVGPRFGS
ncbi:MAG: protein kinase [Actinomycetota bacterium]|nr:protein kinase [Actinomycetota bacterium]